MKVGFVPCFQLINTRNRRMSFGYDSRAEYRSVVTRKRPPTSWSYSGMFESTNSRRAGTNPFHLSRNPRGSSIGLLSVWDGWHKEEDRQNGLGTPRRPRPDSPKSGNRSRWHRAPEPWPASDNIRWNYDARSRVQEKEYEWGRRVNSMQIGKRGKPAMFGAA